MISLVRSGPKTLVLEGSSVQQLVQYLTDSTGTYRKAIYSNVMIMRISQVYLEKSSIG